MPGMRSWCTASGDRAASACALELGHGEEIALSGQQQTDVRRGCAVRLLGSRRKRKSRPGAGPERQVSAVGVRVRKAEKALRHELPGDAIHSAASLSIARGEGASIGTSISKATPVSRRIAIARGKDGVALPDLIFEIIERWQSTRSASAASVIPVSFKISASDFMGHDVNAMNVNVKHVCEWHSMAVEAVARDIG